MSPTKKVCQWFLAFAVAVTVAPLAWSQNRHDKQGQTDKPEKSASAPSNKESETPTAQAGTKISAELVTNLDARTAKPGDEVAARVTKNVKQDGRVVIHKGDRLLGHVTSAEAAGSSQTGSQLAVTFDRLQQGAAVTEMHSVVTRIVASAAAMPEPAMPSAPSMAQAPMGSSGGGRGGTLGGATSTVGGATSTVGGAVNSTAGAAGSATQGVANTGLGATAATRTAAGAAGQTGLATPIADIHLASAGQAANQTDVASVLSAKNGNLRVNSVTQMEFRVAGQAEIHKPAK